MGRKKSNWSGPLSKAERKRVRDGITTFGHNNTCSSQEYAAAEVTAAHRNPDIIGEIREMHPLLTTKLNNITLRHAVKDYLSSNVKDKRFIIYKYGEIGDCSVGGSFAARWARMVLKRCSSERGERV